MARILDYNAVIFERIDLEPTLSIFRIRRDDRPSSPWFSAGQYTTLGLNACNEARQEAADLSVRRPMSIASAPELTGELEFYIRYVTQPESTLPLTHLLWSRNVGERLYCRTTAAGKFTLEHTVGQSDPRLKLMIAAGTGLAPFISIARSRALGERHVRLDDIVILHGASYPGSLGYHEELSAMARDHGLRYLPTISRPSECPEWTGATGRVEALLEPERIEETEKTLSLKAGTLRPGRAVAYVCGLQGTLQASIMHLLSRGFVPNHRRLRRTLEIGSEVPPSLYFEQYDTAQIVDPEDDEMISRLRARWRNAMVRAQDTPAC